MGHLIAMTAVIMPLRDPHPSCLWANVSFNFARKNWNTSRIQLSPATTTATKSVYRKNCLLSVTFAFDLHSEFAYIRIVAAEENLTSHMYAVDCLVEKHPLRGWSSNNHIAIVNCIHRLRIFTIPVALCYPARRARVFQLIDHSASKIPKHHSVRMHRCVVVVAPARGAFNFYAQTVDIFVFWHGIMSVINMDRSVDWPAFF